jgi:uncharacterized RDD family membrane protein YckC
MNAALPSQIYPRLLRRVRAALIDFVVFVALFFIWVFALALLQNAHPALRISLLIAALLALEPGLVAWTGGTIGHHAMGLRIRDAEREANIGFLRASIRAVVRALLGWVSFAFVLVTKKHQAIHDYVSSTVVVLREPTDVYAHERLPERVLETAGYILPSKVRRTIVVLLYCVVTFFVVSGISALGLSESCQSGGSCTAVDEAASIAISVGWLALLVTIIFFGARGKLYGCRRRPRA